MRENGFYWIIFEGVKQVAEFDEFVWYLTGESKGYLESDIEVISKEPLEYPKTFKL